MKATYTPGNDDVRAERRRRYLEGWPVDKQLEAFSEAAMGRPGKLDEMTEGFAAIRAALPFFEEE
jgi:hypothetical protein